MDRISIAKRLGRNVRRLRRAKDVSQEAFAELIKINRSYMSGIENGTRNPTIAVVGRIADNLGVEPAKLFE
jgi:transcriptional regulator with XRE-family HTH domain